MADYTSIRVSETEMEAVIELRRFIRRKGYDVLFKALGYSEDEMKQMGIDPAKEGSYWPTNGTVIHLCMIALGKVLNKRA